MVSILWEWYAIRTHLMLICAFNLNDLLIVLQWLHVLKSNAETHKPINQASNGNIQYNPEMVFVTLIGICIDGVGVIIRIQEQLHDECRTIEGRSAGTVQ